MATIDFGDLNQKMTSLKQTQQTLQHMFMVQCYSSGLDPLSVDIDSHNFAVTSDALATLASSLISIRGHISEVQELISQGEI